MRNIEEKEDEDVFRWQGTRFEPRVSVLHMRWNTA
jgi:hypothetical protein